MAASSPTLCRAACVVFVAAAVAGCVATSSTTVVGVDGSTPPASRCADADWEGLQSCLDEPDCPRTRLGESCSTCLLELEACPEARGCGPDDLPCAQRMCRATCVACLGEAACFQPHHVGELVEYRPLSKCTWSDLMPIEMCGYGGPCAVQAVAPGCSTCAVEYLAQCPDAGRGIDASYASGAYGEPAPNGSEACQMTCARCFGAEVCRDVTMRGMFVESLRRAGLVDETPVAVPPPPQAGAAFVPIEVLEEAPDVVAAREAANGQATDILSDSGGGVSALDGSWSDELDDTLDTTADLSGEPSAGLVRVLGGREVDSDALYGVDGVVGGVWSDEPFDTSVLEGVGGIGVAGGVVDESYGYGLGLSGIGAGGDGLGGGGEGTTTLGLIGGDEVVASFTAEQIAPRPAKPLAEASFFSLDGGLLRDGTARCHAAHGTTKQTQGAALQPSGQVRAIGVGDAHCCWLTEGGAVACWGEGADGRLGLGGSNDYFAPQAVEGLVQIEELGVRGATTCARQASGAVFCWGSGQYGVLGDGTHIDKARPVAVRGLDDAAQIALGSHYACVIRDAGTVACWGYNQRDALGDRSGLDRYAPVEVVGVSQARRLALQAESGCALSAEGRVDCWGAEQTEFSGADDDGDEPPRPPVRLELDQVVDIVAGTEHTCALQAAGQVWCWGRNGAGQMAIAEPEGSAEPTRLPAVDDASAIYAGGQTTCVRHADAHISCGGARSPLER